MECYYLISKEEHFMLKKTKQLTDIFNDFQSFRDQEEEKHEQLALSTHLDFNDIVDEMFYLRVEQALPYATLHDHPRMDYVNALIDLHQHDELDQQLAFAAFVFKQFGIPNTKWCEFKNMPRDLLKWLYRNSGKFRQFDFSFSDFEEAFKEASYRHHVNSTKKHSKKLKRNIVHS
jgi:hypothetical protein